MSAIPIHQQDATPNRLKQWGEDLTIAKAMVYDLTTVLKRLDENGAALREAGVTGLDYTLGPIGDAAASTRRDLDRQKPNQTFRLPRGD